MPDLVGDFTREFHRYREAAEKAIAQIPDEALNHVPATEANSIAMLVRHISGNLRSRFTDFLTSDGEKPWRDRDSEFVERAYSRAEIDAMWQEGWRIVDAELARLTDGQLDQTVSIRGAPDTVHGALCRAVAHVATHAGQIVLLARLHTGGNWATLTIPKRK